MSIREAATSPATATILIVDDTPANLALIVEYLEARHFRMLVAQGGEEGLQRATLVQPDLILLDAIMPGIDGFEVCRQMRAQSNVPIVMLTARDEEPDRVVGFELGADDYVVKPFSVRELLLRIDAVLRRGKTSEQRVIEVAELRIDKDAHRVTVSAEEVLLTALEFKLLVTLIERRDRVQGRGTLLSDVWAMDSEIASRTVDTHVKRLRDKLGTAGRFIETVRGVGYRFSESPTGSTE